MTSEEIRAIKSRINDTLAKRSGVGSVAKFSGEDYQLPKMEFGSAITAEVGEKTIDLLLNVTGNEEYPELGNGTKSGGAIPSAFNIKDINRICDDLDKDLEDEDRGGFVGWYDGKYYELPGGKDHNKGKAIKTEHTHCAASCTGVCVGSCIGMCNGCTGCFGCSSSCEIECGGGCANTCAGSCSDGCSSCVSTAASATYKETGHF